MVSSSGTVPPRPCCDLWGTVIFDLSMARSLACNWGHQIWQGMLWPNFWTQEMATLELRAKFVFIDAVAEEPQNLLLFFWVFCIRQGTPETKQSKSIFWISLVRIWNHNSFAAKATNCLLVMVWEHRQPGAGRGPAWEPSVSQGQPGITAHRGQLASLSWVPGNHR